jgi:hypothetical protein
MVTTVGTEARAREVRKELCFLLYRTFRVVWEANQQLSQDVDASNSRARVSMQESWTYGTLLSMCPPLHYTVVK